MFVQCLLTAGFQCSIMAVCMAKSSRGLRQGDPLAPSFLIIAEEVFSRGLLALYAAGAVKLHVPRGGPATSSHILFADDTIIFTNGWRNLPGNFPPGGGNRRHRHRTFPTTFKHFPFSAI